MRKMAIAGGALVLALGSTGIAGAHDRPSRGTTFIKAASYINPDTGMPTENPDVNPGSECRTPDFYDQQQLSDPGMTNRNVHNDACLLEFRGRRNARPVFRRRVDGPATFQATGVGVISACPDPDGSGPKFSVLSDTNADGRNDRCFQSGFQEKNADGDREFHVRLNNSTAPGRQRVRFCYDSDRDGCSDEPARARVVIDWRAG